MSLKDKIMSSSPNEMSALSNWAFVASVSTYQLYEQFILHPIEVTSAFFIAGLFSEIAYLIKPAIKRAYVPQIDIKGFLESNRS